MVISFSLGVISPGFGCCFFPMLTNKVVRWAGSRYLVAGTGTGTINLDKHGGTYALCVRVAGETWAVSNVGQS